jgi:dTDP-glucose 4,6-dehydratase
MPFVVPGGEREDGLPTGRRFDGKRVIVAGGAGFIGGHLCKRLQREGAAVLAIDNLSTGRKENLEYERGTPIGWGAPELLEADLNASPASIWKAAGLLTLGGLGAGLHLSPGLRAVPRWVGKVDYVFNLASPASPPIYDRLWFETMKVNSAGVSALLDMAVNTGAVFVQASTSEIYGEPHFVPTPEADMGRVDPTSPRSVYDEAKRFAETMIYAFMRNRGAKVRVARIFNTYGPGMRLDDGRVVPSMIQAALLRQPIPVFGDGWQTRSFCYVSDMVEGLLRLALSELFYPVNLGGTDEMPIRNLVPIIERLVGAPAGMEAKKPLPDGDPTRRCPDIFQARSRLGWEPTVTLESGLRQTIRWARQELGEAIPCSCEGLSGLAAAATDTHREGCQRWEPPVDA